MYEKFDDPVFICTDGRRSVFEEAGGKQRKISQVAVNVLKLDEAGQRDGQLGGGGVRGVR